jgi:hypothetical protein
MAMPGAKKRKRYPRMTSESFRDFDAVIAISLSLGECEKPLRECLKFL